MMKKLFTAIVLSAMILASGCASSTNQQKGTGIGAAAGAALGMLIFKNDAVGALVGAAVGGTAGNLIGKNMDKQAQAIKQEIPDAEVQRVGEGINVTFNSDLLFEKGKADLNADGKANIEKISKVFLDYPDTYIVVEGHTSADPALASPANEAANLKLSEERARAVGAIMRNAGLKTDRVVEKWHGGSKPKHPNDTEESRAKNRRVEIAVIANEQMQQAAKEGKLQGQ